MPHAVGYVTVRMCTANFILLRKFDFGAVFQIVCAVFPKRYE
jgi:hypothetical protein